MLVSGLVTLILALLGTPLFAVIAANALIQLHAADYDVTLMFIEMVRLAKMPMLLPIPLFTFAGYVLARSQAPKRLVRVSRALFGWMPGGLAVVCILACSIFTAFTGASGVTIVALGGLLYPALIQEKYNPRFSLGLMTTAGSLGILFAPSLPLILYGIVAEVSVDDLFRAGFLPGILMLVLIAVYSSIRAIRFQVPRPPFNAKELCSAVIDARYELPLPLLILAGIYSGTIAISEAAVFSAFLVLFVEMVLYKDISIGQLAGIMRKSMILVGAILIIMGCSLAYTNCLLDAEVPMKILDIIQAHISSRFTFLLLLNVFLLIVGCMLDIFSALIVVIPLILPIAREFGIDPIHLGIIFLTNLNIGYMTPPVGLNLFIASLRFKKSIVDLYVSTIPFLLIMLLALILVTYIPWISLFWIR
ncbi:TRAP transporter large permease subunit [bacterium]|nr:TRAP transporter large permease subunit [candidate division CSSED10-310 bacterium]